MPREFPPRETAYWWFGGRRTGGTFERLDAALRERLRARSGRNPLPSAGIAGVGGEQGGYDGNEKARGRKRRLSVGTEGSVLEAEVHSAKVPDQDGPKLLLGPALTGPWRPKHPRPDAGYRVRGERWAEEVPGLSAEVVRKPRKPAPEKVVLARAEERHEGGKRRRIGRSSSRRGGTWLCPVDGWRTFSWLGQNRRMGEDYERPCAGAEAFVYAA